MNREGKGGEYGGCTLYTHMKTVEIASRSRGKE
jgi:hypothetical protein